MKGWFDAFRTEGGPTLYSYNNRTPVTGDVSTFSICLIFSSLYLIFLIVLPGVRKDRFSTFITVTLTLFVGHVILVTIQGSYWHVSEAEIKSDYIAFSPNQIRGKLGVYVGFEHVNVTLKSNTGPELNRNLTATTVLIDYNERFHWENPEQIDLELKDAMETKGLPFPILTVVKYFSYGYKGRIYRLAGLCAKVLLWASFASWLLMVVLLIAVPCYGAYLMILTSLLMLTSNLLYFVLLPNKPLVIRFEQDILEFQLGLSYWMVLIAGSICGFAGIVLAFVDLMYPDSFSTIFEVDYDSPFDRHIILCRESLQAKNHEARRLRSLEDPAVLTNSAGFQREHFTNK